MESHRVAERAVAKEIADKAVAANRALAKKRAAAPSWSDYISRYGEQGAVRNKHGRVVGYQMPKPDDPEKRRRIANEEYERWQPHRRISIEQGGEHNARIPNTTLLDRKTGAKHVVPAAVAARRARAQGLVEESRARGARVERGASGGMLWKWQGRAAGWFPLGVRCLGVPLDGGDPEVKAEGYQFDPDGGMWEHDGRGWVKAESA